MLYCSQRKMRLILPENDSEHDEIVNLTQGWALHPNAKRFWIRIRYYDSKWLDKEITRSYQDGIEPSYTKWRVNRPGQSSSKNHAFMDINNSGLWDNGNSNANCANCLGYHVICEETTSPFIRPSPKSSLDQSEAILSSWGPEYKITFELKPIHRRNGYDNVMIFDGSQGTNPDCGVHIPEIHKAISSAKHISFRVCANGVWGQGGGANTHAHNGSLLDQFDWNQIEVAQRNIEGQYQFYVKIGETEIWTVNNNDPLSFQNVYAQIGQDEYTDIELRNIQGKVCSKDT